VKLALGFNPVLSAEESARVASQAENLGYDSIWMHESLYQRDVVTCIAAMAEATSRIRIGSGVINTFTRHPVAAAATFATLAELSHGRIVLGVGLGSFPTIPLIGYGIFPVEKTRPLVRIAEYVKVVKSVWKGEKVEFDGEFFQVHNLSLGFKATNAIPIFIASLSPKTQAYAATVADGVILSPALSTVGVTARMVRNVAEGESKRGRSVERASYMMTSVDPNRELAIQAVRSFYFFLYQLAEVVPSETLHGYGVTEEKLLPMKEAWKRGDISQAGRLVPYEAIEALTITGSTDHAVDRVKEYTKAGVTLPILMPIGNVSYAMNSLAAAINAQG